MITEQRSRLSPVALGACALMVALGLWLGVLADQPQPGAALCCALLAAVLLLARVRVRQRGDVLLLSLPPFPARMVHLADVRSVSTQGRMTWSGAGYRWYGPGMWGLVVGGPEITINFGDGQMVVASCADPQLLADELVAAGAAHGHEVERVD